MSPPPPGTPDDGATPIHVAVPDYVYPLIPQFLGNRRLDIAAIRDALTRQDYETIRLLGHRMKGDGASYGLNRVSELGLGLERAAGQRDAAGVREALDALADFVARLQVSSQPPAASPPT